MYVYRCPVFRMYYPENQKAYSTRWAGKGIEQFELSLRTLIMSIVPTVIIDMTISIAEIKSIKRIDRKQNRMQI
ncbi:hypothetical protein T07_4416 [Trichinella nelsoni]|uniref:Uncharacterized protein n=1 Tax=Trichinella nelsoni TaxID=6336 RepID=A0A0V0S2X7_9BILA|nr:hypothetical protein T07_4416 [Trichinella nelsoni]